MVTIDLIILILIAGTFFRIGLHGLTENIYCNAALGATGWLAGVFTLLKLWIHYV